MHTHPITLFLTILLTSSSPIAAMEARMPGESTQEHQARMWGLEQQIEREQTLSQRRQHWSNPPNHPQYNPPTEGKTLVNETTIDMSNAIQQSTSPRATFFLTKWPWGIAQPEKSRALSDLYTDKTHKDISTLIASYVAADLYTCTPVWSFTHTAPSLEEPVAMPCLFTPDERELITTRYNEEQHRYEIAILDCQSGRLITKDVACRYHLESQAYETRGIPYEIGCSPNGQKIFVLSKGLSDWCTLAVFTRDQLNAGTDTSTSLPSYMHDIGKNSPEPHYTLAKLNREVYDESHLFEPEDQFTLSGLQIFSTDQYDQSKQIIRSPRGTYAARADEQHLALYQAVSLELEELLHSTSPTLTLMDLLRLQQLLALARAGKKDRVACHTLFQLLPKHIQRTVVRLLKTITPRSKLDNALKLIHQPDNRLTVDALISKSKKIWLYEALPLLAHEVLFGWIKGEVRPQQYNWLNWGLLFYGHTHTPHALLEPTNNRQQPVYTTIRIFFHIWLHAVVLQTLFNIWD